MSVLSLYERVKITIPNAEYGDNFTRVFFSKNGKKKIIQVVYPNGGFRTKTNENDTFKKEIIRGYDGSIAVLYPNEEKVKVTWIKKLTKSTFTRQIDIANKDGEVLSKGSLDLFEAGKSGPISTTKI